MQFCVPSQSMIIEQEFRDASEWKENLTTCHNVKQTFEIVSEFEKKCIRKVAFWIALLHENDFLQVYRLFRKKGVKLEILRHKRLGEKNFPMRQILNWNSYSCQKLKRRLHSWSDVMINATPWKHCLLQFVCLLEVQGYVFKKLRKLKFCFK